MPYTVCCLQCGIRAFVYLKVCVNPSKWNGVDFCLAPKRYENSMGEGDLPPFCKKKLCPISWTLLMASKFRDTFFCLHLLYVSSILNSQNEPNLLIQEYLLLSLQFLEKSLNIVSLIFFQRFLWLQNVLGILLQVH